CDSIAKLNWGDGQGSAGHIGSGGMAMHTYTLSGTYIISWLAIEYNNATSPPTVCYEQLFSDTVMVKCCDTCSCGTFDFLYAVSRGPLVSKHCGDTLALPLPSSGLPITFISSFSCMGTNCTNDSIDWKLTGPSSFTALTGKALPTPLFAIPAINSSTFTAVGLYTLTLTGHCGGNSCPPCKIYFYQPENCCQNYDMFVDKIRNAVQIIIDNDQCKASLKINGLSACDSIVQINWGDNVISTGHLGAGGILMHSYTNSGTYFISYTAFEYNQTVVPAKLCFEKVFRDTITVSCCDSCKNNLIKNPGFSIGAIGGELGNPGASSNWTVASGTPQVGLMQGCCDPTIIQMWGNRDNGEAICQSFNFIPGRTYSIRFKGLYYSNIAGLTIPYVRFGFTAANGCIDPFSCSRTDCVSIGSSINITDTACKEYSIVNWTAPSTPVYNSLIIRAFNNSPDVTGNFSNISFGRLDNICVRDVSIISSDPKLKFKEINMNVKPNPTTDKVIISLTNALDISKNTIRLISIEGKVLRSILVESRETQINMEEYASGLYFISLHDAKGKMLTVPAKIIKQ
ncbi:MAG: T9SS type A sorting domain-containing protein, partial [Saprospiraceae bacterium]